MAISNLTIPYPDFKYADTINADEFDANNAGIVDKINEIVPVLNSADSYGVIAKGLNGYGLQSYLSGARTIGAGAIEVIDVTWLNAFVAVPIVTSGLYAASSGKNVIISITNVTTTGCTIRLENGDSVTRIVSGSLIAFGKTK